MMDVVEATYSKTATQGLGFQLTDEELLKVSTGVGRIDTI